MIYTHSIKSNTVKDAKSPLDLERVPVNKSTGYSGLSAAVP